MKVVATNGRLSGHIRSTEDHRKVVHKLIDAVITELVNRADLHDITKFDSIIKPPA